eukprot:5557013-Alexandrium_andersonii.AAC.1
MCIRDRTRGGEPLEKLSTNFSSTNCVRSLEVSTYVHNCDLDLRRSRARVANSHSVESLESLAYPYFRCFRQWN